MSYPLSRWLLRSSTYTYYYRSLISQYFAIDLEGDDPGFQSLQKQDKPHKTIPPKVDRSVADSRTRRRVPVRHPGKMCCADDTSYPSKLTGHHRRTYGSADWADAESHTQAAAGRGRSRTQQPAMAIKRRTEKSDGGPRDTARPHPVFGTRVLVVAVGVVLT